MSVCSIIITCLTVVHPVEYDLRCSVPTCHNIACHFALGLSCQTEIQDLTTVRDRHSEAEVVSILA